MPQRDPTTPIDQKEHFAIPGVWLIVIGLVIAGTIINFSIHNSMVVWPFVFAVAALLIINDASDRTGAGVPPIQAYALFFGTLIVFFIFVALVSRINAWLFLVLLAGASVYVVRDWKRRREKKIEIDRLRVAGLCIRCGMPVRNDVDAQCENCGQLVNPERLNLFHIGKAISLRANSNNARQVLTGQKPARSDIKLQKMQQQRAYRYKKK
jgi:Ca2+/Na+ antiporter